MDSTNNQLRDHSNLYIPYSNGGVVSIQFHCFFSIRKYGEQYRQKTSWSVFSRVSAASTSHNHFGQSQWTQKIRRSNQNSMRTHVVDKRRAKMVKSESRVILVLLLNRQLKTVLGMQMNMRNSYI